MWYIEMQRIEPSTPSCLLAGPGDHRGNPAASLRVKQLYGLPVLLSGTAALVLKKTEESHIDMHYKNKLQSLMKLHQKTPRRCGLFSLRIFTGIRQAAPETTFSLLNDFQIAQQYSA